MKRKWLVAVTIGVVMVLSLAGLAGCGDADVASAQQSGTTVNLSNQQEGIWVSGSGEVTVTPDLATLQLGIQSLETSVAEAQAKASEAMDKVMAALKQNGVADKDIQTQYFSIQQRTRWDQDKQEELITGYQVTNTVLAKIRDIEKVGSTIDAVVAAGGDLTRINSINFSVDNPKPYYEDARKKAMDDAKAKAEQLAGLAGVTLGKPLFISEGTQSPVSQRVYYESMGGMAVPAPVIAVPVSPGELKVTLTVQVTYDIVQ